MIQRERLDRILTLIRQQGYVTVNYLTRELQYSTATINRDLNILQEKKLIQRNYGGAELTDFKEPPLPFRYHKMKAVKRNLGKVAAGFVQDGDTIFMDASTTVQYMAPYLTERNGLTVISNNMALLTYLSEGNIRCICLGGEVVETPSMLMGPVTAENARLYRADKFFFSTIGFSDTGDIYSTTTYYALHKAMADNAGQTFYLGDHKKRNVSAELCLRSLRPDYFISDGVFAKAVQEAMPETTFVTVSENS